MKNGSGGITQGQTAAKHIRDLGFNSQHQKRKTRTTTKINKQLRKSKNHRWYRYIEFYRGMNLKDETK